MSHHWRYVIIRLFVPDLPVPGSAAPEAWRRIRRKQPPLSLFSRRGINHGLDLRDFVRRETALFGVFADHLFIRRNIYTVDLIASHITLDPLNLRSHFLQHSARSLRYALKLVSGKFSGTRYFAFDQIFRHN